MQLNLGQLVGQVPLAVPAVQQLAASKCHQIKIPMQQPRLTPLFSPRLLPIASTRIS